MVNGGLTLLLHPSRENTSFQLYSIPAQQLVRAYNSGTMSDADKEEIRSWYVSDEGLAVYPHLADPAKGYLDRERIQRSAAISSPCGKSTPKPMRMNTSKRF